MPGSRFDLHISWQADDLTPSIAAITLTLTELPTALRPGATPLIEVHEFALGLSNPELPSHAHFTFVDCIIYVSLSQIVATEQASLGLEFPVTESSFFRGSIARWSLFSAPPTEAVEALIEEALVEEILTAEDPRARQPVKKVKLHKRRL